MSTKSLLPPYRTIPKYSPPPNLGEVTSHGTDKLDIYKDPKHDSEWVYLKMKDEYGRTIANVIYDKFPKSRMHLLVVPTTIDPYEPDKLTKSDLVALKKVHRGAMFIMDMLGDNMLIGYHAIPSMTVLHLHIISNDFDSLYLKRKENYVSFLTDYFIHPQKIERAIEREGKFTLPSRYELVMMLKNAPVECHKCGRRSFNHFTMLKKHLKEHADAEVVESL